MELTIGGARGSYPASGPAFTSYGGHTTSLLIEGHQGTFVLIDAGTGIRLLGDVLSKKENIKRLCIFFTHYHLDHIVGLASLPLLYQAGIQVEVIGPSLLGHDCERALRPLLTHPYWPIDDEVGYPASLSFKTLPGEASLESMHCNELTLRWCPVNHPGGCVAYRIDEQDTEHSIVVASDVEWQTTSGEQQKVLQSLCTSPGPVDLLIFDGQYTPKEYAAYKGWGHSTWMDAVEVTRKVHAKRLLVTHHAPESDDAQLDSLEADLQEEMPGAQLARQGAHFKWP